MDIDVYQTEWCYQGISLYATLKGLIFSTIPSAGFTATTYYTKSTASLSPAK